MLRTLDIIKSMMQSVNIFPSVSVLSQSVGLVFVTTWTVILRPSIHGILPGKSNSLVAISSRASSQPTD